MMVNKFKVGDVVEAGCSNPMKITAVYHLEYEDHAQYGYVTDDKDYLWWEHELTAVEEKKEDSKLNDFRQLQEQIKEIQENLDALKRFVCGVYK